MMSVSASWNASLTQFPPCSELQSGVYTGLRGRNVSLRLSVCPSVSRPPKYITRLFSTVTPPLFQFADKNIEYRCCSVGCECGVNCLNYYRPRSQGDNTFGSVSVSVRLSVGALLFEPFDL